MTGSKAQAGLIPRLCEALIARADAEREKAPTVDYKLEASYLEIYCEKIKDLYVSHIDHG